MNTVEYAAIAGIITALLCASLAYGQIEPPEGPEFTAVQSGNRTILFLSSDWSVAAINNEIKFTSTTPIEKILVSDWWNATLTSPKEVKVSLIENVDRPSKFMIFSDKSQHNFDYEMVVNSTSYSGTIVPEMASNEVHFKKWTDGKEHAASAYIPERWKADLQIIRPYESMTGFVFFAKSNDNQNTLLYIFQPFMPMNILPSKSLCKENAEFCVNVDEQKTISTEKVREMSLGNAPVVISAFQEPEKYFDSQVLPILKRSLESYTVESSEQIYVVKAQGNSSITAVPALQVLYSFDADGKEIKGTAYVFTANYTSNDIGFWNGFIIGVESTADEFKQVQKYATVPLLTLEFDKEWLSNEKKTLFDNNINDERLREVSVLIANSTLGEFDSYSEAAAGQIIRSNDGMKVTGFIGNSTESEMHLPVFSDMRHWYLSEDGELLGRKMGRNTLGSNVLEVLR